MYAQTGSGQIFDSGCQKVGCPRFFLDTFEGARCPEFCETGHLKRTTKEEIFYEAVIRFIVNK